MFFPHIPDFQIKKINVCPQSFTVDNEPKRKFLHKYNQVLFFRNFFEKIQEISRKLEKTQENFLKKLIS